MNQEWGAGENTTVMGDAYYVPVTQEGEPVGERVFIKKGAIFPALPTGTHKWVQEGTLLPPSYPST